MNPESTPERGWFSGLRAILRDRLAMAYLVGIVGAFLIVGLLVWAMLSLVKPPALGEDRAAVRAKALAELRAAEAEALNSVGWVDPVKGTVRLRIEDAMNMVEREWKNPPAARSNLLARVEKATAAPPKPPETPSPFE